MKKDAIKKLLNSLFLQITIIISYVALTLVATFLATLSMWSMENLLSHIKIVLCIDAITVVLYILTNTLAICISRYIDKKGRNSKRVRK